MFQQYLISIYVLALLASVFLQYVYAFLLPKDLQPLLESSFTVLTSGNFQFLFTTANISENQPSGVIIVIMIIILIIYKVPFPVNCSLALTVSDESFQEIA